MEQKKKHFDCQFGGFLNSTIVVFPYAVDGQLTFIYHQLVAVVTVLFSTFSIFFLPYLVALFVSAMGKPMMFFTYTPLAYILYVPPSLVGLLLCNLTARKVFFKVSNYLLLIW